MKSHWEKFYKNKRGPAKNLEQSKFAEFVFTRFGFGNHNTTVLDMGCGNGRDSYYLGKMGYKVTGIDDAIVPQETKNCYFSNWINSASHFDIVYSRFFLHAVPRFEVMKLLNETTGYFVAEARAIGDKPKLYPKHQRWLIDPEWLIGHMVTIGYEILYFEKGRGLAKYKGEDPLIVRIIAKRI